MHIVVCFLISVVVSIWFNMCVVVCGVCCVCDVSVSVCACLCLYV